MKHRITEGMDRIISFVNDFTRDNRRSPTVRQIAAATGISRTTVHRMTVTHRLPAPSMSAAKIP